MKGSSGEARAEAFANIALAKYWGKADVPLNLPAVPSISITLDPLRTETHVRFDPDLERDGFELDQVSAEEGERRRVEALLDQVRAEAGMTERARVVSRNHFPTAAGLASSASGFAALAAAARAAAGLDWDTKRISSLARQASASAARSVFGGFVELPAGEPGDADLAARPLFAEQHWDLCVVVAVTAEARKPVGSTRGMNHTRNTSPYYRPWVDAAPALAERVRAGVAHRDLPSLGAAMEQSTLAMHACAMAADPGILYWQPATLSAIHALRAAREQDGLQAWLTVDAGPHVKALCAESDVDHVKTLLDGTEGVLRTLVCRPGSGVKLV